MDILRYQLFVIFITLFVIYRCQEDVVEYLLTHVDERQDLKQIDAYELLGASFANDKDNYDLVKAFYYLAKGMSERWENWENLVPEPILKPPETLTPSHRAYNNRIECASPEDLGKSRGIKSGGMK